MAFNFNWSPLIADTSRAREMLTTALNKSPKPPIIVDDILVTELNLGSVPPELEILEIGDLAEDRFRGIFKMQYTGDAFMTLRTRVQANPLNTYLSTKPKFASPQPLAAASGLTIPLQITLSDIRLSGFVILVFSKQKGITIVFRNDPLEALKVSSTFDSIPFVRDYLQKEIEGQLRLLFMEDLPAIIHRLSLRLWSSEHSGRKPDMNSSRVEPSDAYQDQPPIDPFSSPSQAPRDSSGRMIDESDVAFLLDDSTTTHASFSHKNLLRLAALTDSHRTLSLFTPPVKDVVYRAWAGAPEGRDGRHQLPRRLSRQGIDGAGITFASLSRKGNSNGPSRAGSVHSFSSEQGGPGAGSAFTHISRPSLNNSARSYDYYGGGSSMPGGIRSSAHKRKRRHRIVNLRPPPATAPILPEGTESGGNVNEDKRPASPVSYSAPGSASWATSSEREGEIHTPPDSPSRQVDGAGRTPHARPQRHDTLAQGREERLDEKSSPSDHTPHHRPLAEHLEDSQATVRPETRRRTGPDSRSVDSRAARQRPPGRLQMPIPLHFGPPSAGLGPSSASAFYGSEAKVPAASPGAGPLPSGGILEQAWMMKMAAEIGRRVEQEKQQQQQQQRERGNVVESFWNNANTGSGSGTGMGEGRLDGHRGEVEDEAPPPYGS